MRWSITGRGDDHPWLTFVQAPARHAVLTRGACEDDRLGIIRSFRDVSIHWRFQPTHTVYPLRWFFSSRSVQYPASKHEEMISDSGVRCGEGPYRAADR